MSKGQFPLALFFLSFIIMLVRMPSEDVSKLMFHILEKLENGSLLGYLLAGGISVGWYIHAKWQRRGMAYEVARIAGERDSAQESQLKGVVKSSK